MKIIFFYCFFVASCYGFEEKLGRDGTTPSPFEETCSTVSSSVKSTEFFTNLWQNILSNQQRDLFSSRFPQSTDLLCVLKEFSQQYTLEKNKMEASATIRAVLKNMGLLITTMPAPSPETHTVPACLGDDSDDDDPEDDSQERLQTLWAFLEKTPKGKVIKDRDLSSAFALFCHLYDASFSDLTAGEGAEDVNGFAVIDNIFTPPPVQIKEDLLEKALTVLRHARTEETTTGDEYGDRVALTGVAAPETAPAGAGRAFTGEAVGAPANEPPAPDGTAAPAGAGSTLGTGAAVGAPEVPASNTTTANHTQSHVGADDPDHSEAWSSKRTPPDRKQLFSSFPYSWKQVAAGIGAIGIIVFFGKWAFSNVFPVDADPSL